MDATMREFGASSTFAFDSPARAPASPPLARSLAPGDLSAPLIGMVGEGGEREVVVGKVEDVAHVLVSGHGILVRHGQQLYHAAHGGGREAGGTAL